MQTAIYCRVSTEEQATEGFSIHAQKDKLTKYANINDWNIVDYYVDDGISGKKYITYQCNGHNNNSCNAPGFSHIKIENAFINYLENIKDLGFDKSILKKEEKILDMLIKKQL